MIVVGEGSGGVGGGGGGGWGLGVGGWKRRENLMGGHLGHFAPK